LLAALPDSALAEGERFRLRVLTYNVWGVAWITPMRTERMMRIPEKIAELQPDIVAIEEAWTDEDAAILIAGLSQAGLTHVERHSPAWPDQNGLLIASRYPLRDFHFKRFTQGHHPHVPWHVDYMSGKGVARVKVDTPVGPVFFAATHLQASYGSNDYIFVQMHQALEAAEELDDHSYATIFAGDVNSKHDGLPARILRTRADLTLTDPNAGIDQILYRPGTFVDVEVASVKEVLTEAVDLGDATMPLSDHPGVLAELDLVSCGEQCAPATLGDRLQRLDAEVFPLIDAEIESRNQKATRDLVMALLLPMFGVVLVRWRRRSLGRSCMRSAALAVLLVLAAGWFVYLHTSFGPAHLAGLLGIRGKLAAAAVERAPTILSRSSHP